MKEILQKWLFDCVGITFTMEDLGKKFKDGFFLSKLLEQYGVVHRKAIKHILPSDNAKVCKNNLRDLCVWFNLLDVMYNEEIISKIANGKTTTCLTLLYDLFLTLNDRERLKLIQRESEKVPENNLGKRVCKKIIKRKRHSSSQYSKENVCEELFDTRTENETPNLKISSGDNENVTFGKGMTLHERMRLEDIQFVKNELQKVETPLKKKQYSETYIHALKVMETVNESPEGSTTIDEIHEHSLSSLNNEIHPVDYLEQNQLKTQMTENILQQAEYEKQLALNNFEIGVQKQIRADSIIKFKSDVNNESTNYTNFFSTCKSSEEEITYQLEAINKMELHRKLYDDKIRKRNQRRQTICQKIIENTIELAIKISEYGKESVTKEQITEWNKQLHLGKSILDEFKSSSSEDIPVINIDEQHEDTESLNDLLFDNYNHLIGDWFAQTGLDVAYDDLRIIAHIVYRLQKAKRPSEKPLRPANITKYKITSVLSGEFDELSIIKLQSLLVKPKILIIDIRSAISYCIDQYKLEADIKPPEVQTKKNGTKSGAGKSTSKTNKNRKSDMITKGELTAFEDKEVQTSSSLFENCDKPKKLSSAAEVGMRIYNLETSTDIPVEYMIGVLIEYIKSQSDIKGWVLINFPSTLTEAYHVEKILSGNMFPNIFNIKIDEIKDISDEIVTQSRLVYLPIKRPDKFISYFTSFINMIQQDNAIGSLTSNNDSNVASSFNSEEGEEEEIILNLADIYRNQGILKEFIYNKMDFSTLKNLARVILQYDSSIIRMKSSEIFGKEVIQYYDISSVTPIVTENSANKKSSKKTDKDKDEMTSAKEFLQHLITLKAMGTTDSQCEEESIQSIEESIPEINLYPGEDGWNYAKFIIPEDESSYLSNLWENLESTYISSLKSVLQTLKDNENTNVLYENYVIKIMNDVHNNQQRIEQIVNTFTENFNKMILCIGTEGKDLMYKVRNFERSLWEISEEKKDTLERKRRELIEGNWVSDTIVETVENYMALMEVETTRCNSTLTFLYNYYSSMCGEYSRDDMSYIEATNLSQYSCDLYNMKCSIAKRLTDETEIHIVNPMSKIFENVLNYYTTEICKLKLKYDNVIAINQQHVVYERQEWKRDDNDRAHYLKELRNESIEDVEEEATIFNARNTELVNMFHEWSTAIKSEMDRFIWRIKIIKGKTLEMVNSFENNMANVFHKFYDSIIQEYLKENECIDNLCHLFQSAIDKRSPVTANIIIEGNFVYYENEFTNARNLSDFELQIEHQLKPYCPTIQQLEIITRTFKSVAPDDIIDKYTFYFIVEDMIAHNNLIEEVPLVPSGWNNVTVIEMREIFKAAFGDTEKLYWKNFIIYCLDIPYPDIQDIVELRERFESFAQDNKHTISFDNYSSITLWFQEDSNDVDKASYNNSVTQLLFFLFETDENEFDYIDFLLLFSKGESSVMGFSKALASLCGKCVIHSFNDEYLENILKVYDDMISNMVREILHELLINIWNERYSVKIEEIIDEPEGNGEEVRLMSELIELASTKSQKLESVTDEDVISSKHQASQTVSFTEVLDDISILKSKIFKWTARIPTTVIYDILENKVVKVFNPDDSLIQTVKDTIAKLDEDGLIHIPTLMAESSFHIIFYHTRMFQTFSIPNAIKDNMNCLKYLYS